jgi:probable lipoprotein NlpC
MNVRTTHIFFFFIILFLTCGCAGARKAKSKSPQEIAIETARSYLGTPYRYGGSSKAGIDCSGLLVLSYKAAGVDLPRTTNEQVNMGRKVGINSLKPGDLVFFATGKKKRKISHVGMVTEVKNKENISFIHASTSLGVMEDNIFSNYYRKRFRKARRVF